MHFLLSYLCLLIYFICLSSLSKSTSTILNKLEERGYLLSCLNLEGLLSHCSDLIRAVCVLQICAELCYFSSFLCNFCHEGMLSFLSEVTMCFLSSGLFMCYLPSIDLCLLSHPCISGMKKDFIGAYDVFNMSLNWVCNYFIVLVII